MSLFRPEAAIWRTWQEGPLCACMSAVETSLAAARKQTSPTKRLDGSIAPQADDEVVSCLQTVIARQDLPAVLYLTNDSQSLESKPNSRVGGFVSIISAVAAYDALSGWRASKVGAGSYSIPSWMACATPWSSVFSDDAECDIYSRKTPAPVTTLPSHTPRAPCRAEHRPKRDVLSPWMDVAQI